jgi:hypothetical protein
MSPIRKAFFTPIDRFNERYEELVDHPDWSFHGRDFPSFQALMEARDRLFAPSTRAPRWVALHVGPPCRGSRRRRRMLDRFPHVSVDWRRASASSAGSRGVPPVLRPLSGSDRLRHGRGAQRPRDPQQIFGDALYEIYYRFLETEDEYFDYAPAPVPPQGRWRIYGIGLPRRSSSRSITTTPARLLGLDPL